MAQPLLKHLSRFILIKPEEYQSAGHFFLIFLLIGIGLSLGRGSADALFFKRYGIENLVWVYFILGVSFSGISLVYAAIVDRFMPEKLLHYLLLMLSLLLAATWLLVRFARYEAIYPIYYLIYELYSEFLLLHIAFYLTQNLDTLQLKRLSATIFAGVQLGTILGGLFLSSFVSFFALEDIIAVWSVVSMLALLRLQFWHHEHGVSPHFTPKPQRQELLFDAAQQLKQGLYFLRESKLLRAIFIAIFFMGIAHFTLSYAINLIYIEHFGSEDELARFFGLMTTVLGFSGLLLQMFLTGRLVDWFGVKAVNLFYPLTSLFCFIALLIHPVFLVALFGHMNRDIMRPVFSQPVRNLFFNALPAYIQGRARAMMLAFVLPGILLCTSALLHFVAEAPHQIWLYCTGLVSAGLFLVFSSRMNRHYIGSVLSSLREQLYLPQREQLDQESQRLENETHFNPIDPFIDLIEYLDKLLSQTPSQSGDRGLNKQYQQLLELNDKPSNQGRDQILFDIVEQLIQSSDASLRAICIRCMAALDESNRDAAHAHITAALEDEHPGVRQAALKSLLELDPDATTLLQKNLLQHRGTPRSQAMQLQYLLSQSISRDVFIDIALAKLAYAARFSTAVRRMQQEQPQDSLLPMVVKERIEQALDLCLLAMKKFEEPIALQTIEAGLRSPDSKSVSRAVEGLYSLRVKTVANELAHYFDNFRSTQSKRMKSNNNTHDTDENRDSTPGFIDWCLSSSDHWLAQCARHHELKNT